MDPTSVEYIRRVQRKNGQIIIRTMLELEVVTEDAIVTQICVDYNIFHGKKNVTNAVRAFVHQAYYLGFIDVKEDQSFDINHSIKQKMEQHLETPEAEDANQSCPITSTPHRKRNRNQR